MVFRGVAQLASALAWGARGRPFKSVHPDNSQIMTVVNQYITTVILLVVKNVVDVFSVVDFIYCPISYPAIHLLLLHSGILSISSKFPFV